MPAGPCPAAVTAPRAAAPGVEPGDPEGAGTEAACVRVSVPDRKVASRIEGGSGHVTPLLPHLWVRGRCR